MHSKTQSCFHLLQVTMADAVGGGDVESRREGEEEHINACTASINRGNRL